MLTLQNVTVSYANKPVITNLSFSLQARQWMMITGPNGAGKSTLLSAIAQSIPYQGNIYLFGKNIHTLSAKARAQKIAVLSQVQFVGYAFTVRQVVGMGRYPYQHPWNRHDSQGEEAVELALRSTGLWHLRDRNVLKLSGGEMQRTALARVFAQQPSLLLLDEPINHLDLVYQKQLFEIVNEWLKISGRAVLSVMHDISAARRFGTHALLLREGQCIAQGTTNEVFTEIHLQQAYQMDVHAWIKAMLLQWL